MLRDSDFAQKLLRSWEGIVLGALFYDWSLVWPDYGRLRRFSRLSNSTSPWQELVRIIDDDIQGSVIGSIQVIRVWCISALLFWSLANSALCSRCWMFHCTIVKSISARTKWLGIIKNSFFAVLFSPGTICRFLVICAVTAFLVDKFLKFIRCVRYNHFIWRHIVACRSYPRRLGATIRLLLRGQPPGPSDRVSFTLTDGGVVHVPHGIILVVSATTAAPIVLVYHYDWTVV